MTISSYGKGYLLMPPKTDVHYGEKYFHDGWWMPKQCGWFFKSEFYNWLVEHGANSDNSDNSDEYKEDLSNMSISEYGKGYILHTTDSDEKYGQKYFMNGYWNNKQKGWFFKAKYFDDLVSMSAKFIKPESVDSLFNSTELSSSITNDSFEYVHDDNEFMTNDTKPVPKFFKYGKGWILKQDNHYKYKGKCDDYFEGGWWISSIKSWFFKNEDKKKFMSTYFEI